MTRPVADSLAERVPADIAEALRARIAVGVATYGVPLHTDNGRDAVKDAREELLDALLYVEQARMEGRLTNAAADAVQRGCVEGLARLATATPWVGSVRDEPSPDAEWVWETDDDGLHCLWWERPSKRRPNGWYAACVSEAGWWVDAPRGQDWPGNVPSVGRAQGEQGKAAALRALAAARHPTPAARGRTADAGGAR